MNKIDLALIGAGNIGKTHLERIAANPNVRLCALVEPGEAGRNLARNLNVRYFGNHHDMLGSLRPDGAIVATPNSSHVEVALDLLNCGVAALVEKPIASDVQQARALVAASAASSTPVLVGHHRRHNPIIRRAHQIIQSARLGKIVAAHAFAMYYKPSSYFEVAWRREPGGGPILINLIHDIDVLLYLLGPVHSVQAIKSNAVRGFEVEDSAAAVLQFSNGALATLLVSDTAVSPWCWDMCAGEQAQYPRQNAQSHYITGTLGALSLPDLQFWSYPNERHWHKELSCTQTMVHAADSYSRQLEHFVALIQGREPAVCSAQDGLHTLEVCMALHTAHQTGQAVSCNS